MYSAQEIAYMLQIVSVETLAWIHHDMKQYILAYPWQTERPDEMPVAFHVSDPTYTGNVVFAFPPSYGYLRIVRPGFTSLWIVGDGDRVFIRSTNGRGADWFRWAIATGTGRIPRLAIADRAPW